MSPPNKKINTPVQESTNNSSPQKEANENTENQNPEKLSETTSNPKVDTPEEPKPEEAVKFDKLEGQFNKAQTIINNNNFSYDEKIKNDLLGERDAAIKNRFSPQMLKQIQAYDLDELSSKVSYLIEMDLLDKALNTLLEYGILLLIGPSQSGTRDIALRLAGKLNINQTIEKIHITEAFSSHLRINIELDISQNNKAFANSTIIFKEAIKRKNKDFLSFFEQIELFEQQKLDTQLLVNLKKNKTFIILTTDIDEVKTYRKIQNNPLSIKIPKVNIDIRKKYLAFGIKRIKSTTSIDGEQLTFLNQISDNWLETICTNLLYIEGIDRFLNQIGEHLLKDKNWIPDLKAIKAIVQSINSPKEWLFSDISKNLKNWNYVYTLGLLYCFPDGGFSNISLIEFELFRKQIERHLIQKSKIKISKKEWEGLIRENEFFHQCRIVKRKDTTSDQIFISFDPEETGKELWQVFLNDLSFNTTQLIPFLISLIESNVSSKTAARVLGRIYEIDHFQSLGWMSLWANSGQRKDRFLIGYLMQGVISSENNKYISICESHIKKLGNSNNFNQIMAAIVTYKQIGIYKLEEVMVALGDIAKKTLSPLYEQIRQIRANHSWATSKIHKHLLFNSISREELIYLFEASIEVSLAEQEIEAKIKEIQNYQIYFLTISYSISSLCKEIDPISVFDQWRSWMQREDRSIKVFLIKMLLPPDGVLDQLNGKVKTLNEDTQLWEEHHYMVTAISIGEEAIRILIDLFSNVVNTFSELEPGESKAMEDYLIKHIETWIDSSIENEYGLIAIVELYAAIVVEIPQLSSVFTQKLNYWTHVNQKDLKLKIFAEKVKSQINVRKSTQKELGSLSLGNFFNQKPE